MSDVYIFVIMNFNLLQCHIQETQAIVQQNLQHLVRKFIKSQPQQFQFEELSSKNSDFLHFHKFAVCNQQQYKDNVKLMKINSKLNSDFNKMLILNQYKIHYCFSFSLRFGSEKHHFKIVPLLQRQIEMQSSRDECELSNSSKLIQLYQMTQKSSSKPITDKNIFKQSFYPIEHEQINRPLLHYGSMNSMPIVLKEQKQQKQSKQSSTLKASHLVRRPPEDELRRFNSQTCFIFPTVMLDNDSPKKVKISTDPKDQYKSSIGSKGSRGSLENDYPKIINNLKQTSSTSSAEVMSVPRKQAPAFLKSKSKAILNKNLPDGRFNGRNFKAIKKLGQGKFGKVFLAVQTTSGFMLAMKVIQKKKIIQDGLLDQFIKELKIQAYLKHPNIIQVYGFFQDQKNFYTLMELGCDGQLYNLIFQKKRLTQEGTSFISKNLLQAVDYMHGLKILHRDIKPQNIVRIMGNVKICDFGWAANKMTKEELRSTYCGTPLYLSPEIIKGQKYDQKVDLWAIGILAYELLIGKSPFDIYEQEDLYKIMTDQVRFPSDKKTSKQFQEFINHILNKNPKERLSSSQLLELKFIKKYEAFETCEELCQ